MKNKRVEKLLLDGSMAIMKCKTSAAIHEDALDEILQFVKQGNASPRNFVIRFSNFFLEELIKLRREARQATQVEYDMAVIHQKTLEDSARLRRLLQTEAGVNHV